MNLFTNKNRLTDLQKELMVTRGEGGVEESQGVWDRHVHTTFKMDNWENNLKKNRCMYMHN